MKRKDSVNSRIITLITRGYSIFFLLCVLLQSCQKGTDLEKTHYSNTVTATIRNIDTKTTHLYSEATLKTNWKEGDTFGFYDDDGKLIKFQTSAVYDSGKAATFSTNENFKTKGSYRYAAYVPYSEDGIYDISLQSGKLEDLHKYDILKAEFYSWQKAIVFEPMCVIIRIPKNSRITSTDYSGNISLNFKGYAVESSYVMGQRYMDGNKTVTVKTNVSKGLLIEDTYISFFYYQGGGLYYLDTDRGDHFEFFNDNINSTDLCLYTLDPKTHGYVEFEDINFKIALLRGWDVNKDNEISFAEAKTNYYHSDFVSTFSMRIDGNISSLKGIEHFKSIFAISIRSENPALTEIDLSKNTKLKKVILIAPNLQSVNTNNCALLQDLSITSKKQLHLDLSTNSDLKSLVVEGCLTKLDLTNNRKLEYLACSNNLLESLDLSNNIELSSLDCELNNLTELDLRNNTQLYDLNCMSNKIKTLILPSSMENLWEIRCAYNNISGTLDFSTAPALNSLCVCYNNISKLLLSPGSESVFCRHNQLKKIDLSELKNLREVDCSYNNISEIDISTKWGIYVSLLRAWPMKNNALKLVKVIKGKTYRFNLHIPADLEGTIDEYEDKFSVSRWTRHDHVNHSYEAGYSINPADYGTTIVEVD